MPIAYSEDDFFDLTHEGPEFGFIPKYKILIEGDSWVSHPLLMDLATQFDYLGNDEFAIFNLAKPGDTAKRMFSKNSYQLKKMGSLIHDKQFGYEFDMIFLSASGNDIVGEEILTFVDFHNTGGKTGVDLINKHFKTMLNEVTENYENVIKLRNKSKANKKTPIVCHCYCYIKPRKAGTKLFGAMFGDGWVKQYLDMLDIPKADQQKIINHLLDEFLARMKALQAKYDNFLVVDTRKVLLKNGKPSFSYFYDEIHPKAKGFQKVAKYIRREARKQGMWPQK